MPQAKVMLPWPCVLTLCCPRPAAQMEGPGGVEDSEIVEMALHPTCGLHVHITPRATMSSATESSS